MYVGLRGTANLKASVKPEGGRGAGNLGILPARGRQELGKAGTKVMYVPTHVCILPTSGELGWHLLLKQARLFTTVPKNVSSSTGVASGIKSDDLFPC